MGLMAKNFGLKAKAYITGLNHLIASIVRAEFSMTPSSLAQYRTTIPLRQRRVLLESFLAASSCHMEPLPFWQD